MVRTATRRIATALEFIRRAWGLVGPYLRSEERWRARVLLALMVALTLGLVFLQVLFNDWNRLFFEALQNKDFASFGPLLVRFGILATLYIIGAVYRLYFQQMLQMRWRVWLTNQFVDNWLSRRTYYRMEVAGRSADNPDQRIAEDIQLFTSTTLSLALGLLSAVVTLVSFVAILWTISGPLAFAVGPQSVTIPGYMVWVAVLYALAGSLLTHFIGRPLIGLNFARQRVEADFRFGLVRLRENAEGVALYGGEGTEQSGLRDRVERIRANWWQLMGFTKRLTFMTVGYDQIGSVFPLLVAAPRYFAGDISLGVLTQISNAFGQVQGSLSWFLESYAQLAAWKATVDRLLTFRSAMGAAQLPPGSGIDLVVNGTADVRADHVDLALPDGRVLLADTSVVIAPGQRLLITGPSGIGKSTLFRALAGIWPFGRGCIQMPAAERRLFLPQRSYIPIASLRDAVTYPAPSGTYDDVAVREALHAVGLDGIIEQLDDVQNWSLQLSVGEQQRLAIARALLHHPDWLFLDEATSALDEASEATLYALLSERLPNSAIVSVAHRAQVARFHTTRFDLHSDGEVEGPRQSVQAGR
jgi:putative ATP-binding cassette transporter